MEKKVLAPHETHNYEPLGVTRRGRDGIEQWCTLCSNPSIRQHLLRGLWFSRMSKSSPADPQQATTVNSRFMFTADAIKKKLHKALHRTLIKRIFSCTVKIGTSWSLVRPQRFITLKLDTGASVSNLYPYSSQKTHLSSPTWEKAPSWTSYEVAKL